MSTWEKNSTFCSENVVFEVWADDNEKFAWRADPAVYPALPQLFAINFPVLSRGLQFGSRTFCASCHLVQENVYISRLRLWGRTLHNLQTKRRNEMKYCVGTFSGLETRQNAQFMKRMTVQEKFYSSPDIPDTSMGLPGLYKGFSSLLSCLLSCTFTPLW